MRRAERLFDIVQIVRRKQPATAANIADELEVSPRTIYRDIRDLVARGVPIEGEAGVGYILRPGFDLPPLMFNEREIESLLLGARIVQSWGDFELANAAGDVIAKVRAVLPESQRHQIESLALRAPPPSRGPDLGLSKVALRRAIRERCKVRFRYKSTQGEITDRSARPVAMAFYPPVWLLAAWCEVRDDFRVFRVDRMSDLVILEDRFKLERGKTASDFLKREAHQRKVSPHRQRSISPPLSSVHGAGQD